MFQSKTKKLLEENLERMGEWEIAQAPEPAFKLENGLKPILNVVVHRESYFILNMYLCYPEEVDSATKTLLEAIEKYKYIPDILLVREKNILEELEPIAHAFDFKIVYPSRFKAVPNVLREMRKGLRI